MKQIPEELGAALQETVTETVSRVSTLMASKAVRKRLGVTAATKKAIQNTFVVQAVRLAIAEHVLAHPPLYAHEAATAYQELCDRLITKEQAGA